MCAATLQGVEGWDVDLPTYMEANVITTTAIKVAWVFCYILVYGLRPVIVRPKTVGESPLSPGQLSGRCVSLRRCSLSVGELTSRRTTPALLQRLDRQMFPAPPSLTQHELQTAAVSLHVACTSP